MTIAEAFEAHHGYTIKVACGLCGNLPDAEDLASEMWLRMVRYWGRVDDRNLRGLFWTALHNLYHDNYHRRKLPPVSIDTVPDWADEGAPYSDYMANPITLDTIVESRERFERIRVAVLALSGPERRAVADSLAGAHLENAQRVALHRARRHLREAVA